VDFDFEVAIFVQAAVTVTDAIMAELIVSVIETRNRKQTFNAIVN
jgi:hypothetical protein